MAFSIDFAYVLNTALRFCAASDESRVPNVCSIGSRISSLLVVKICRIPMTKPVVVNTVQALARCL